MTTRKWAIIAVAIGLSGTAQHTAVAEPPAARIPSVAADQYPLGQFVIPAPSDSPIIAARRFGPVDEAVEPQASVYVADVAPQVFGGAAVVPVGYGFSYNRYYYRPWYTYRPYGYYGGYNSWLYRPWYLNGPGYYPYGGLYYPYGVNAGPAYGYGVPYCPPDGFGGCYYW